jgi:hypothetical protein
MMPPSIYRTLYTYLQWLRNALSMFAVPQNLRVDEERLMLLSKGFGFGVNQGLERCLGYREFRILEAPQSDIEL